MGRLIDENEVIKAIDRHTKEDGTLDEDISIILEEVRTSYKVDKVVEELEKCIELKVTQYPLQGTYIKKNIAIDIVKKGGVD